MALTNMGTVRRPLAVVAIVALVSLAGCGSSSDRQTSSSRPTAPTTTSTLPPYIAEIAEANVLFLQVFDAPSTANETMVLSNPWFVNDDPTLPVSQLLLVKQKVRDFYEVLLPVRPNGTTGWVRARDVDIVLSPYRVIVELSAHRITVWNGDEIMIQEQVAVGAPETPTPTGTYYTRVLLKAPDPNTVYGPYAYPLSGHSDVLTSFNGGDGELGIHGNNDASALGKSVTAGCVRMSNDSITRMAPIVTLGSPVTILP